MRIASSWCRSGLPFLGCKIYWAGIFIIGNFYHSPDSDILLWVLVLSLINILRSHLFIVVYPILLSFRRTAEGARAYRNIGIIFLSNPNPQHNLVSPTWYVEGYFFKKNLLIIFLSLEVQRDRCRQLINVIRGERFFFWI